MILFEDSEALAYLKNSAGLIEKIKNMEADLRKKGFEVEQNGIFSFDEYGYIKFSINLRIPYPEKKSPSSTL